MKFKLDENFGASAALLLSNAGHDVSTVFEQQLAGADDRSVIDTCHAEGRALVTLDLDFANPLVFPPRLYSGIAVVRLPRRPSQDDLRSAMRILDAATAQQSIDGNLWIIETTRIRIYRSDSSLDDN